MKLLLCVRVPVEELNNHGKRTVAQWTVAQRTVAQTAGADSSPAEGGQKPSGGADSSPVGVGSEFKCLVECGM
jgi:hypothetical protein